jgi:hypothetical protein
LSSGKYSRFDEINSPPRLQNLSFRSRVSKEDSFPQETLSQSGKAGWRQNALFTKIQFSTGQAPVTIWRKDDSLILRKGFPERRAVLLFSGTAALAQ